MKKSLFLFATLAASTHALAHETGSAEYYGARVDVTCETADLIITMKASAPLSGENLIIFEQSGSYFAQGKVEAKILNRATKKLVETLRMDNATDPWESSWPAYRGADINFFAQASGSPSSLNYRGKNLAPQATCKFQ